MNKPYVLWNLKEARQALDQLIADMQAEGDYDYGEFRVDMEHLYHHINTAWNARDAFSGEIRHMLPGRFRSVATVPAGHRTYFMTRAHLTRRWSERLAALGPRHL